MESPTGSFPTLGKTSKQFARRLATIGENRLELFLLEVQEEHQRFVHAFLLALGAAAFGLLAGLTLSAAIVVWLWACSPVAVLFTLTGLYAAAGVYLYRRFSGLRQNWQSFSASLDQLRKDRACLEKMLA
jgi:uncharacterized membrane protein YqjE